MRYLLDTNALADCIFRRRELGNWLICSCHPDSALGIATYPSYRYCAPVCSIVGPLHPLLSFER